MAESEPEELNKILSEIDKKYSKDYQLNLLKFLAESVVPCGRCESCTGVPEVYRMMRDYLARKGEVYRVAVSFLRHMLQITGCKQAKELNAHCCKDFDLTTLAPSLPSYQLLFCLADKLLEEKNDKHFFKCIDENKLNKPKYDLHVTHPVYLFQSMICERTLDPSNLHSLKKELVTILEAAKLTEELKFLQDSVCDNSDKLEVIPLFNFEGQSLSSDKKGIMLLVPSRESVLLQTNSEEEVNDDNNSAAVPLLKVDGSPKNERNHPETNRRRSRSVSSKYYKACCVGLSALCLICVSLIGVGVSFFYAARSSDLSHTQPAYGYERLIYSPFLHVNLFYYISIKGTIHGSTDYNLTVCVASCPLKVVTSHSLVNGVCPKDRHFSNCYVNLLGYHDPGLKPQFYSQYMLTNSNVTFKITELSKADPVQLCITLDKDTCDKVFTRNSKPTHADCQEVLTGFNQINNYTRTFTAHTDSYYCAVWLLNESQSINYTANLTVQLYQLPPSARCKNFYTNDFTLDLWQHRPEVTTHKQDVCILVQENVNHYDNTTISTNVAASSIEGNIAFIFGIITVVLFVVTVVIMATLIFMFVKYFCCS